ncbi:serine protease [Actinomortierella ambigua]|uniref:Serine protease n=1 Tax=Actinomortierella ambigua TaxID=1343610 RepID=A0A9P6PV34_9FUNG|nr:serine protease [Actinomortierella ambigua]
MKVAYLLSVVLVAPLAHAGDYLVKFREGQVAAADFSHISRIQQFNSDYQAKGHQRNQFDYSSRELALTVLSVKQAAALSSKGKSHAQVGPSAAGADVTVKASGSSSTTTSSNEDDKETTEIRSKGRWFTFDDHQLHVWHGDFSEDEVAFLASDPGVEIIEKDVEIGFADLSKAHSQADVGRLEQIFNHLSPDIHEFVELERRKAPVVGISIDDDSNEKNKEVRIPGYDQDASRKKSSKKKLPPKKVAVKRPSDFSMLQPNSINVKDTPGPDGAYMIQKNAPSWGLPRVSQRRLPLNTDYMYPNQAGEGVDVYVIDTGINIHHVDFQGRARWGTNTVPGSPNTDDNGHGTFVAGVIGSNTFGVAKKVNLIAVKGLNREGTSTLSQILSALDWTIKTATRSSNRKNIVNLSLGAGYSRVLNSAVDTLVQSGLFITAAAGNGDARNVGQDACNYSPASAQSAFTVGSTNINDQMSSFSNYGRCVNMYAPGERVRSTWIGPTNREIYVDSGTSFSAPNVAGIAALVMSAEPGDRSNGAWSPKTLGNRIIQLGTRNVVKGFKGPTNTNLLAFNGVGIIGVNNSKAHNNDKSPTDGSDSTGDVHSPASTPLPVDEVYNPRFVSGLPIQGSATNHVSTVSALQTFTVISTVAAAFVSFFWSM